MIKINVDQIIIFYYKDNVLVKNLLMLYVILIFIAVFVTNLMEKVYFNVRKNLIMIVHVIILFKDVNLMFFMNVNVQMDKIVKQIIIIFMKINVFVKKLIVFNVFQKFITVYVNN
jgi:hypothetical protein